MGAGGRSDVRVMGIYGSEGGTAKRGMQKITKKLNAQAGLSVVQVVEGNAVEADLTTLLEKACCCLAPPV